MLRFILLSMFLIETVILAPNTNFVALPATAADVCANCNFPNNSPSSTGVISFQSQPTTTHIRKTNHENAGSETSTRVKRNIGNFLKNEIDVLASGLDSSAEAILNSTGGFFNLLEPTLRATNFVSSIQLISRELRDLNNHDYDVQTVTEQLASKIVKANEILNQMGDAQSHFAINGGAALKSMASNIEILSSIIKLLGKGLQETETSCFNEKNNLTANCEREQNKRDELTKKIELELKDAQSEKVKLEKEIESNTNEIKVLQASKVNLDVKLKGNNRLIGNLLEANKKYILKIVEYEETIKVLKNNSAVFEGDSKVYEDLISMEKDSIKENEQKIGEIKVEIDKLEKEKENLQSNIDNKAQKVKNLEDNLEKYKTEINDSNLTVQLLDEDKEVLVKKIVDFMSESKKSKEVVKEAESNLQQALEVNHHFDKQNVALRNLNSEYKSDIEFLKSQLDECKSTITLLETRLAERSKV